MTDTDVEGAEEGPEVEFMTTGANFNAATARVLERMYSAPEVVAQRSQLLRAMALREGEVALDVGSGPGMLAKEMAEIVGSAGVVSGIDMSGPMITLSRQRCAEQEWADFQVGNATALPFESGVFDVAVDLRRSSPHFGQWTAAELSDENRRIFWVPPGFAHGYYVLSEEAEFAYKCTDFYSPLHERVIRFDDPDIGINWPLIPGVDTLLSEKDRGGVYLKDAELFD